jgi:8-oxo-dGTP pyrophosphatase MutT (NUDIX family)
MTAEPPGEADRPKRRRRRRRKPATGASHDAAEAPGSTDGSGSPTGSPPADRQGEPTSRRRRRRRRATPPHQQPGGQKARGQQSGRKKARGQQSGRKKARGRQSGRKKARGRRIPTQKEISAGGVVYRFSEGGTLEVVLASRRTRRGALAWGLAKGGIEEGETAEDAAVREVREETGIVAEIEESLGDTKYMYVWEDVRIRKTVHFFLMRAMGGNTDDRDDEMEEVRWFPLERALKRAAYRGERDVLGRAAELLR